MHDLELGWQGSVWIEDLLDDSPDNRRRHEEREGERHSEKQVALDLRTRSADKVQQPNTFPFHQQRQSGQTSNVDKSSPYRPRTKGGLVWMAVTSDEQDPNDWELRQIRK